MVLRLSSLVLGNSQFLESRQRKLLRLVISTPVELSRRTSFTLWNRWLGCCCVGCLSFGRCRAWYWLHAFRHQPLVLSCWRSCLWRPDLLSPTSSAHLAPIRRGVTQTIRGLWCHTLSHQEDGPGLANHALLGDYHRSKKRSKAPRTSRQASYPVYHFHLQSPNLPLSAYAIYWHIAPEAASGPGL